MMPTDQRLKSSSLGKAVVAVAKLAVGGGLMLWLWRSGRFDIRVYGELLGQRTTWWLLGIFTGQIAMIVLPFLRWWILVNVLGIHIRFREVTRLGLMGCFANLFVPGGLGIDGVRTLYLRRYHEEMWLKGLCSVIVDRVLGVFALLLLCAAFTGILLTYYQSEWILKLLLVLGGLIISTMLAVAVAWRRAPAKLVPLLARLHVLQQMLQALQEYRYHKKAILWSLLLSVLGHTGIAVAACSALAALHYPVNVVAVFIVTPLVTLSHVIPLTPLGLGVSDGLAEFLYPIVGLDGGAEAQMLVRATLMILFLISGLAYFSRPSGLQANESARHDLDRTGAIEQNM